MMNELLSNLYLLHTTPLGRERIRKNLQLTGEDPVAFCRELLSHPACHIFRQGKNWYGEKDCIRITVNAHSHTIITAHRTE